MNSQTPTPDDGQPAEPLPRPGTDQPDGPLLPPPSAAPEGPPQAPPGPDAGPFTSQYPGPYQGAKAPGQSQDFYTWIRSHGIQRGDDRWIGGVASGIAHRMGIDPLIVRGIFIVLTLFAGIGVLLYGLAWAFLPEPDGRIHVQEAGAGRWSSGMTGSLIATVLGLTGLGGGFWGWRDNGFGGFLWTVFWVGGAIYLIYYLAQRSKTRNGVPMAGTPQSSGPYGGSAFGSASPTDSYTSPYPGTDSSPAGTSGSAPYLPVPPSGVNPRYGGGSYGGSGGSYGGSGGSYGGGYQPQGRAPKVRPGGPGAPAVAITAGAALLVGGGLKALDAGHVINLGNSPNAIVWASGAAVLGLGILVAGLRGKTSGVLGFFAVVALIIGGIFNVVGDPNRFRFSQVDWAPTSQQQAADGFNVTGGRGTVDLTQLASQAPLPADVVVPLDITASNVTVVLPNNIPVDVRADMTLGNLNEGTNHRGGTTSRESSYNTDKPGGHLILRIDGTVSNVTIQEGN
ncbi:MAG TPA: PspC domain-containing protein [Arthrobacter sp.]|nr:PspC domain-containing protein [Arthrobacter sp.]